MEDRLLRGLRAIARNGRIKDDGNQHLSEPTRHFTKVSSLPLLGLEYFHEYLDRYSAKEQRDQERARRLSE